MLREFVANHDTTETRYCVECGKPAHVAQAPDLRAGHSDYYLQITCRNEACALNWFTLGESDLTPDNLTRYNATVNYDVRSGDKAGK